jgi:hypothetical protein
MPRSQAVPVAAANPQALGGRACGSARCGQRLAWIAMLAGFGQRKLPLSFGTSCSGNAAALPAYVPVNEPEYPQLIGLLTATFRLSVAASPGPNVSEPDAVPSAAQPSAMSMDWIWTEAGGGPRHR